MALTSDEANELASLTAALLAARTGTQAKTIIYNGERTDFADINLPDLRARVEELNALAASSRRRRHGAVAFGL